MSKKGVVVKEMIGGCCVCSDERGWSENPLVYCDGVGCNVAVHQACYGIVQVPTGPWFCKKCESQERVARVKCDLCPQRAGALKRTDSGGWCHVVCALYIPEAWFANVETMEPIVLRDVPQDRFNKICYICEEEKRDTKATAGACMECNRNGCKQYFHVTCAQGQGLLCEVTSSHENVKYCGYCFHHYKKLKNQSNVKTIPAFQPIANENTTPDTSPEKNPPIITDDIIKPEPPPAIKEVKSPQVDQSVSSTSDSVPPTLIPNVKTEFSIGGSSGSSGGGGGGQINSTVSRSFSEVSDISSVLSPMEETCGEEAKHWSSDPNQEPSSSNMPAVSEASAVLDSGASPSMDTMADDFVDVVEDPCDIDVKTTASDKGPLKPGPKRQKNSALVRPPKDSLAGKKNKSGQISSTVHRSSSSTGKERKKNSVRKRRDSGGTAVKTDSSSLPNASLPGHHDYCGSLFGGSPYFQSLAGSGHVSMPGFSSQDTPPMENGLTHQPLFQPPKLFPSLSLNSSRQNQHRSQDFPLSMEQLLEQQWEQGAQFLMEQSQHFDIASLLNSLHHLKGENQNLENQVKDLTSRRDHLAAVNARLSLPLSLYDGATASTSKSSSMGSLEDISSPDDVQAPSLGPESLASVQIPNHSDLMVEDILSPAENDASSITSDRLKFSSEENESTKYSFGDQTCTAQPLMYSVVNPPPPTLSTIGSQPTKGTPPVIKAPPSSSSSSRSSSMDASSDIAGLHLNSNSKSMEAKQNYL